MKKKATQVYFIGKTLRRLFRIARPFFSSEQKWLARGLLVLLACFSISVSLLNVLLSYINRDFMTALSLREKEEFFKQLIFYLIAFAGISPVGVLYRYTEERYGLLWRRWLSLHTLEKYFSNRAYYKVGAYEGIDNPDQRIEEDVRNFCGQSLSILLILFNSAITITAFAGILWSISWMLVAAVIFYALIGSASAYYLGKPLIGLSFQQLRLEADYRYKLVNIRDNAESIAFYGAEGIEKTRTRQRLKRALNNLLAIISRNLKLNFFTTNYNYVLQILPTVIVAPLFLNGKIEFGSVLQAGGAFVAVVNALSIIVTNFGQLSSLTAIITRLGTFFEALDEAKKVEVGEIFFQRKTGDLVACQNVTILTPRRDQTVLRNLNLEISSGGLLVTGPSGMGKSTILRVLSGLWNCGSGTIITPAREKSLYLPQRPYMVLGSFRNQILYGIKKKGVSDGSLLAVINQVGLSESLNRVGGLNSVLDWPNFLSTGEQQRIAFARLILSQPEYVFLDEATTAIDPKTESYLYGLLSRFAKVIVSIGHRSNLSKFHTQVIELLGDGNYKLENIVEVETKQSASSIPIPSVPRPTPSGGEYDE